MGKYLSRIVWICLLGLSISPFAISASLPEGAVVKVRSFTFPKASYTASNEEPDRLATEFYNQLIAALEQTGLQVDVSSDQEMDKKRALTEEKVSPESIQSEGETSDKVISETEATVSDKNEVIPEQVSEIHEVENDQLMQLVESVEKDEKAKLDVNKDQNQTNPSGTYVITGTITQYEELVGVPVSTGNTKRSRVEVSLLGSYKVVDLSGKTLILEKLSASATRVVPETMDIYEVIQSLGKKAFLDAAHNIAERVSGKKRAETTDDTESGNEEEDYVDSPGKRLKSKSGRLKWIIN